MAALWASIMMSRALLTGKLKTQFICLELESMALSVRLCIWITLVSILRLQSRHVSNGFLSSLLKVTLSLFCFFIFLAQWVQALQDAEMPEMLVQERSGNWCRCQGRHCFWSWSKHKMSCVTVWLCHLPPLPQLCHLLSQVCLLFGSRYRMCFSPPPNSFVDHDW